MRPGDTESAARAVQIAAYRAMSPAQRAREAVAMSEAARTVAESGARQRAEDSRPQPAASTPDPRDR